MAGRDRGQLKGQIEARQEIDITNSWTCIAYGVSKGTSEISQIEQQVN